MAFPYIAIPPSSGSVVLQPYGICVVAGLALGAWTAVRLGRRAGIAATDLAVWLPITIFAMLIGAHVFDVLAYPRDFDGGHTRWLALTDGVSLFGALIAVAATTAAVGLARGARVAVWADVMAVAVLVALTIGRVGCAIVHDHIGAQTDSVFGVDFPAEATRWLTGSPHGVAMRAHDLGLEELLALLPICAVTFAALRSRRPRAPGVLAAGIALAYAVVRFALDTWRLEPRHAGLTAGQWCSLVMAAIAIGGLALARRGYEPAVAPAVVVAR